MLSTRLRASRARVMGGMVAVAALLAACGSSGTSPGDTAKGLPSTIRLYSIQDLTGVSAAIGGSDEQGMNLAVSEINGQRFLGSSKLTISYGDSATTPSTGADVATQAVAGSYAVVFGSPTSTVAQAEAPIFARSHQPAVFTQAGGGGVLIGPSIFRMTNQQATRLPLTLDWLHSRGARKVAVLQDSDNATLSGLTQVVEADASGLHMQVVGVVSVLLTQSDISAAITKLLSYHPDAIQLNVQPTQNPTAVAEIRRAGFSGPIGAQDGAGGGVLAGAGAAADGVTWAADWFAGAAAKFGPTSEDFAKDYQARYGQAPTNFAAEAFDAVWFAARALKEANSVNRADVTAALTKIGQDGFDGVLGHIRVVDGQEQTTPVLVQWQDGKEVPADN
jgi:branched-chain amino acid transport system substrate-binding protein